MGNAGRSCFLFLPLGLTLLSLLFLIFVLLSNSESSSFLSSLYFLRIDTSKIFGLPDQATTRIISAYYDIGVYNYCSGTSLTAAPNFCSPREDSYFFDPVEVWGLSNTSFPVQNIVPSEWADGLKTYKAVAHWMFIAYIISIVFTIITLVIGVATFFFSRISSFVTSLCSDVAAFFILAASVTAVALHVTLEGFIHTNLGKYGVKSSLGGKLIAFTFISAGLAMAASFLWTCGVCCGRSESSRHNRRDREAAAAAGNIGSYERVPSPYKGGHEQGTPLQQSQHWPGHETYSSSPYTGYSGHTSNVGYEPYRTDDRV